MVSCSVKKPVVAASCNRLDGNARTDVVQIFNASKALLPASRFVSCHAHLQRPYQALFRTAGTARCRHSIYMRMYPASGMPRAETMPHLRQFAQSCLMLEDRVKEVRSS
jgi:hypothetical protein